MRGIPRNYIVLSLCACLALTMFAVPAALDARALLWGFAVDGPVTRESLHHLESSTGLRPDIVVFFVQWPPPGEETDSQFPLESLNAVRSIGAVPCITWEPMYLMNGREATIGHAEITSGRYEAYIRSFAEKAREWNKPLLIRFGHEMNIKRYHWGTSEAEYGPESPEIYKRMYRYVADVFRKTGAGNVRWVFCPNAENVPDASYDPGAAWNTIDAWYPGGDYVDIMGIDGYNWGATRNKKEHGWDSRWMSFRDIFQKPAALMKRLNAGNPEKPLIVFETSSAVAGGDKQEWIADAVRSAPEMGIDGIIWFESNKEIDWRIESGTGKEYIRAIKDARLNGHGRPIDRKDGP